jgi:hypothetical protein
MSSTQIRKSVVENFVVAFVKQKRRGVVKDRHLQEGIDLIDDKLAGQQVDPWASTDSLFVRQLSFYLKHIPLSGNQTSLERSKQALLTFCPECS